MSADRAHDAVRERRETPARGAATRTGLLPPAREAFTSVGSTDAGVTGIVAKAGASVGSLYHQFTGALMLAVAEVPLGRDEAAARVLADGVLADGVLAVLGRIDITSRG
jgi:AcrR family transcriptional regulator